MKRPCELNIFLFLDPLPNNFVVVSAHKVITTIHTSHCAMLYYDNVTPLYGTPAATSEELDSPDTFTSCARKVIGACHN
jgi:hypothetical protein